MPMFQVHRMKEAPRQLFRWAPHTSGVATVKPKDYEKAEVIEAASAYAAWEQSRKTAVPLQVGDLLEVEDGALRICKYIGFEQAQWWAPETVATPVPVPE